MSDASARVGDQESLDVFRDRTRAWWMSVLTGQCNQPHPVQGTNVTASIEDNVLVIRGMVSTEEECEEIAREVEQLAGNGVREVRNHIEVMPEVEEQAGLLVQTLLAMFESEEQASFAQTYLDGHAHVRPRLMLVVPASGGEASIEAAHGGLPGDYWGDAERALAAGRSLLILNVDETAAFAARELLDEETRSVETIVLPPVPAPAVDSLSVPHETNRHGN